MDSVLQTMHQSHFRHNQTHLTMNSLAIVAFFAAMAVASAGVLAPSARILEGPSSGTTLQGPDGSIVSSVASGGRIISEEYPGAVAHAVPELATPIITSYAAPRVVAHSTYAAPAIVSHSTPVLSAYAAPAISAYSSPLVSAYSAPLLSTYAAPALASGVVAHKSFDTVVAGPSGTIATSKTVATPAILAGPTVYTHGVHGLYL